MKAIILALLFLPQILFAKDEIKFATGVLKIGKQTLKVEKAETPEEHARGLMFRKTLSEGTGMIFIFSDEAPRSFWMKNTFVPLAIGFFDSQKQLIDIQEMAAATSEMQTDFPSYPSNGPAKYALEVPKGWFSKHKIGIGQKFELK